MNLLKYLAALLLCAIALPASAQIYSQCSVTPGCTAILQANGSYTSSPTLTSATLSSEFLTATAPSLVFTQSGAGTNLGAWGINVTSGTFAICTYTDAGVCTTNVLSGVRGSTTNLTSMTIGGSNTTYSFPGGNATYSGGLTAGSLNVTSTSPPAYGPYRPTLNSLSALGLRANGITAGYFDNSGNFVRAFGEADISGSTDNATASGGTYTYPLNVGYVVHNQGATQAAETIALPAAIDGTIIRGFCDWTITALTLSPNTGQSIKSAPTTCPIGTGYALQLRTNVWRPLNLNATPLVFTSATSSSTALGAATCAATLTTTASGVATTMSIVATPAADLGANITAITWPTSGQINTRICNPTNGTLTPNAVTFNYRVIQ